VTPEERFNRIEEQIATNTAAIRDLIVVSHTLVDAQLRTDGQIQELRDAQTRTDGQIQELRAALHGLIETVDRFIQGQGRNGQQTP